MKYDYLVVGAGLFGSVFAYEAKKKGKTCLVIDKRPHIGGNVYCEEIEGINVHKYGAHIFHTSNKVTWEYINQFAEFNNYINSPVAVYKDELYNLPFNMNTFSKMWNIRTPQEAKDIIAKQIEELHIEEPKNLEEQALSLAGRDVYENFRPLSLNVCHCVLPMTIIILMTVFRGFRWAVIQKLLRKCWMVLRFGQIQIILSSLKKIRILRKRHCLRV